MSARRRSPVSPGGLAAIRLASPADVERVAAIERASFADPWSEGAFRQLLSQPAVWFAVLERDARVAGYAVLWVAGDEAELGNIAVTAEARGQGMGGQLLRAALGEAAARGAHAIYLEMRASNDAARALYAAAGFETVGRRRDYYRRPVEDALILRRSLRPAGGIPREG